MAIFIALELQISFCQDSWQNIIGERPYVYRIVVKFKCIHGCWLKQLVSPSLNTTSLVHLSVHLYSVMSPGNTVQPSCTHLAAYPASNNAGGVVAASSLLLDVQLRGLGVPCQSLFCSTCGTTVWKLVALLSRCGFQEVLLVRQHALTHRSTEWWMPCPSTVYKWASRRCPHCSGVDQVGVRSGNRTLRASRSTGQGSLQASWMSSAISSCGGLVGAEDDVCP